MTQYQVDIVQKYGDLALLEEDWNRLAENQRSVFLDFDWHYHAAQSFHREEDLRVIAIREGGRIQAIAPLVSVGTGICRRLEIIGSAYLFEPTDFLYESPEALTRLANAVLSQNSFAIFNRLPAESPIVRLFRGVPSHRAITKITGKGDGSAVLHISGKWIEFEKRSFSRRTRDSFKKCSKLANGTNSLHCEILYPRPESLFPLLNEVFRVEASGWKKEAGTAVLMSPDYKEFFYNYGLAMARKGKLLIAVMKYDGEAIASHYVVVDYNRVWELKIGYNENFSKLSPGLFLKNKVIEHCFERMLEGYEFLGKIEPRVHHIWTNQRHDYCSLRLCPMSLRGLAGIFSDSYALFRDKFAGGRRQFPPLVSRNRLPDSDSARGVGRSGGGGQYEPSRRRPR